MRRLADKGFLTIYGIAAVLFVPVTPVYVTGFFWAVAVSACAAFLEKRTAAAVLLGGYCAGAVIWPGMVCFLPLISYDILRWRLYLLLVLVAPAMAQSGGAGIEMIIFLLLGIGAAMLLEVKSTQLEIKEEKLKKIRDDSAERNLLLKEKNKELLEKQDYEIYTATLRERNRIAREIHDNVGHLLSRTILITGALKAVNKDAAVGEPLAQLENSLNQAMDSVRKSVHDIHDDSVDLQKAVEGLILEFQFCRVGLEYDMDMDVPRTVKYCLLSILKEALVNVAKHSDATEVHVLMREHPTLYQMKIQDNGSGAGIAEKTGGIGLLNMKERVKALDGNIQISRDHGFGIFITIPKEG